MAFQSTIACEQRLDNKELSGMRIPIAVKAWSTASGEVRPLMFKYKDYEGILQTVNEIKISRCDEMVYFSEKCKVYHCRTQQNNCAKEFRIVFYYERSLKWEMVI